MRRGNTPATRQQRWRRLLMWALTVGTMLSARAMAEPVSVFIRMNNKAVAAPVHAGDVVGKGRIQSREPHTGFQLSLNNTPLAGTPNCYTVNGLQDSRHFVHLCLSGEHWLSDSAHGQGVTFLGSDIQADFTITVDENTVIAADDYALSVNGRLLAPE